MNFVLFFLRLQKKWRRNAAQTWTSRWWLGPLQRSSRWTHRDWLEWGLIHRASTAPPNALPDCIRPPWNPPPSRRRFPGQSTPCVPFWRVVWGEESPPEPKRPSPPEQSPSDRWKPSLDRELFRFFRSIITAGCGEDRSSPPRSRLCRRRRSTVTPCPSAPTKPMTFPPRTETLPWFSAAIRHGCRDRRSLTLSAASDDVKVFFRPLAGVYEHMVLHFLPPPPRPSKIYCRFWKLSSV